MENVQSIPQYLEVHTAATPSRFSTEQAARWVSVLLSPPLLGVLGMVLLGLQFHSVSHWVWLAVYALGSLLGPVVLILVMMQRGEISDFHMAERRQRIKPMTGFLLLFLLSWLIFQAGSAPSVFQVLATAGVVQSAILLLVTLSWKISGHGAGAASFSVYLWGLYGAAAAPAILLIPLVIWARVVRRRHSLSQSLAGAAVGGLTMLAALAALHPSCPGAALSCF